MVVPVVAPPAVVVVVLLVIVVVAVVLVVVVVGGGAGREPRAAAASSRPRQLVPQLTEWSAVASRVSTAACGVSPRASSSARVPDTWGVALEVPESALYWFCFPG